MYSYVPKCSLRVLEEILLVILKLKTTQISFSNWLNKHILVYSNKRILCSNENEQRNNPYIEKCWLPQGKHNKRYQIRKSTSGIMSLIKNKQRKSAKITGVVTIEETSNEKIWHYCAMLLYLLNLWRCSEAHIYDLCTCLYVSHNQIAKSVKNMPKVYC